MNAPGFEVATQVEVRRPRAQDVNGHIGVRLRQLRIKNGLTQQALADLIGVTSQQEHKYETGMSRISASKLYILAKVLEVDLEYFFEGLEDYAPNEASPRERVFLDLARNFRSIRAPKHQEAICLLTRILANVENGSDKLHPDTDDGRGLPPERHGHAG